MTEFKGDSHAKKLDVACFFYYGPTAHFARLDILFYSGPAEAKELAARLSKDPIFEKLTRKEA